MKESKTIHGTITLNIYYKLYNMNLIMTCMYRLLHIIGYTFHFLVNAKQSLIITMLKREFNTGWIKSEFKSFGKNLSLTAL